MALLCCCCAAQDALDCSTGRGERHGKRKRTNCVGAPSTETSSACQAKRRLLFVARSLALPLVRSLSLSLSLSLARARARILLRGARHEALESAVRHFAVDNERRTHLKTATVESRTGDVIFQILRELSAKFCGELALFFRRQTESAGWRRWTITSPKFNTFRLLQRAPTPESRKFAPCVRVL